MRLVEETLSSLAIRRPCPIEFVQHLCLDKGYDYASVRKTVAKFRYTARIRTRGEERKKKRSIPGYRARRWVCERTHSWMNRFRRILVRWEKKAENYIAILHFACTYICLKAANVLG